MSANGVECRGCATLSVDTNAADAHTALRHTFSRHPWLQIPLRLGAICSWIALTVLSLVPGHARPHTGASGNEEHVVAYVLAALVTRLAFPHVRTRWQVAAFSAASAFFEVCQIWIPGRSAGIDNWVASTLGALAGAACARVITHLIEGDGGAIGSG